jgi:hypothetical protein
MSTSEETAAATTDKLASDVEERLNVGGGTYDRWTLRDGKSIDYGYLAQTYGDGINDYDADDETTKKAFYLTTAINYTNGPAHMGHAYEGTTSDVISRYNRLKGDGPCYFVTGSDEHGQKIAETATKDGDKAPQDICDKVSRLCDKWRDAIVVVVVVAVVVVVVVAE